MSQVIIQTPIETVAASKYNAAYYTGGIGRLLYSNATGKHISAKKEKDLDKLISTAIEDNSIEALKAAITVSGISPFDIEEINEKVEFAMKGIVADEKELDVYQAMKKAGYSVVMSMLESRAIYYVRQNKRSGDSESYKIFVKDGDEQIYRFACNINSHEPFEVTREVKHIPVATTHFDPSKESIYEEEGETYFNMWTAPKLACIKKDAPHMFEPEMFYLLEELIMNIIGHDTKAYTYLLNALAKSYQTKNYMTSIIALTGTQGTGKQVLSMLLQQIFTEAHIGIGGEKHNIFKDSDNNLLKDKLVYVLDEVPIGGDFYNDAKTIAGNKSFTLKALNKNATNYPNRSLILNFFNLEREEEIAFKIATGDRRLSIMDGWNPLVDAKYFCDYENMDDVIEYFKRDSKSGLVEYFAWMLATMKVDEALLKRPYDNAIRRRWIEAGKDHTEDFYNAVLASDISYFEDHADGLELNGYGIVNTIQKMFDPASTFQLKVLSLSLMFKEMFGQEESKKIRDRVMAGNKTRSDGNSGEFIYRTELLEANRMTSTDTTINALNAAINIPKPIGL